VIEILSFRLAPDADTTAFVQADRRVQTEFAYHQPGLRRRTTARGPDGDWIVIDMWRSEADADACEARWGQDQVTADFMSFLDPASTSTRRYATLD
jgi:hypothetical protein